MTLVPVCRCSATACSHDVPTCDSHACLQVEFNGVQMRYRDGLPLVLKGLTVQIAAGSRCGVVGRTGAGKSSLINCLFRLQELCGGSIVIDGVDISKMGLKQLRSSMAIIPQVSLHIMLVLLQQCHKMPRSVLVPCS